VANAGFDDSPRKIFFWNAAGLTIDILQKVNDLISGHNSYTRSAIRLSEGLPHYSSSQSSVELATVFRIR
jgi:hypothetical protein